MSYRRRPVLPHNHNKTRWRSAAAASRKTACVHLSVVAWASRVCFPKGTIRKDLIMDLSPVLLFAVVILLIWLFNSINVLREYERGVIFRVGRLLPEPKGPGLIWVLWPIDRIMRVSLRTITLDVPAQDVITRDSVTVKLNAVIYFRVVNPRRAIVEVESYLYATSQLAQTTLRSVLGEVPLNDLLSQREKLNQRLQEILDQHTDPWGIKVALVEIKGVDL